MSDITYKYIDYESEEFKQVIELRFGILFKPYGKIDRYEYDELDSISFHLAVLHNDKVIGYSRITKINYKVKITNVVVDPKFVKRGIGFEMMKRHIIKVKEQGINYLYLNARLDTVDFYKKVGFHSKGEIFLSEKSGLMLQEMYYLI